MKILALAISILLQLQTDGTAIVNEQWSIDVSRGTELYLVRRNLGDIVISDFNVSEDGRDFLYEPVWNTNRSLDEKAWRCGILQKEGGCELCWGLGSYGHHEYSVRYRMSNAVKSLQDYDMLHLQLVSPGVIPSPDKVSVRIEGPVAFTQANTGLWGFGFEGTSALEEGSAAFANTAIFNTKNSVIVLLRFDKGIFHSSSVVDKAFGDYLGVTMRGASFSDDSEEDDLDGDDAVNILVSFLMIGLSIIVTALSSRRISKKRVLGCNEKEIGWQRDVPCGGDILKADYILGRLGENGRSGIASAMILRMIQRRILIVNKDSWDNVEISFSPDANLDMLSESERKLYDMMKEASGADVILQKNEFKRWSRRHMSRVSGWVTSTRDEGERLMRDAGALSGSKFTGSGQKDARDVVGYRKFLQDFTLINERYSVEVALWHDLLVFAALFGIADKVAAELREINPQAFETEFQGGFDTTWQTIRMTQMMAQSITNVHAAQMSGASRSGFGGVTSFGGGGGFSGGGFGGGVR